MSPRRGLAAELASADELLLALQKLRRLGYRRLDTYTPYPVPGVEEELEISRSLLDWLVFPVAVGAAALTYLIQWYCNAYDEPLNVGGRPSHAPLAFLPITFEMLVLATSFAAFVLAMLMMGLPRLVHPMFDVPGFESASNDRFWVVVDALDGRFDAERTRSELVEAGALSVASFGGAP